MKKVVLSFISFLPSRETNSLSSWSSNSLALIPTYCTAFGAPNVVFSTWKKNKGRFNYCFVEYQHSDCMGDSGLHTAANWILRSTSTCPIGLLTLALTQWGPMQAWATAPNFLVWHVATTWSVFRIIVLQVTWFLCLYLSSICDTGLARFCFSFLVKVEDTPSLTCWARLPALCFATPTFLSMFWLSNW